MLGSFLRRLRRGTPRKTSDPRAVLGKLGQDAAERHVRSLGMRVLGRNARLRAAEVDLLCEDPRRGHIVIVEVKARRSDPGSPPPEANLSRAQRGRLLRAARALARDRRSGGRAVRIDVVTVRIAPGGDADIRHYPAAVRHRGGS